MERPRALSSFLRWKNWLELKIKSRKESQMRESVATTRLYHQNLEENNPKCR
jgi:hypothetical protein